MDGFYVGDIIGNSYTHENEKYNLKTKDFELFTGKCEFTNKCEKPTSLDVGWIAQ